MKKAIIVALLGMVFGCGGKHPTETKNEMLDRLFWEQSNKFTRYLTKSLDFRLHGQNDSAEIYGDSAEMAYYAERLILRESTGQ